MHPVIWFDTALDDIEREFAWLGQHNPHAADKLRKSLVDLGASLAHFPERGRPGLVAGTREIVAEPPFVLIYRIKGGCVEILCIWHAARYRQTEL